MNKWYQNLRHAEFGIQLVKNGQAIEDGHRSKKVGFEIFPFSNRCLAKTFEPMCFVFTSIFFFSFFYRLVYL